MYISYFIRLVVVVAAVPKRKTGSVYLNLKKKLSQIFLNFNSITHNE